MASLADPGLMMTVLALVFAYVVVQRRQRGRGTSPPFASGQDPAAAPDEKGHTLVRHTRLAPDEAKRRAVAFYKLLAMRRSVRFFDPGAPVPRATLMACIAAAGTAPSGAHCQPWHFCVVESAEVKAQLRAAVEAAEAKNYGIVADDDAANTAADADADDADDADAAAKGNKGGGPGGGKAAKSRMGEQWVKECAPLLSHLPANHLKPYLTEAPAVLVLMKKLWLRDAATGARRTDAEVRYGAESAGIAAGFLIAALHNAGLVTLTSTPLGAEAAIRELLGRPASEKVFLLMPVGQPARGATVPHREGAAVRNPLETITSVH